MYRIAILSAALVALASPALAAEPTGEWLVADQTARIKIDNCGESLWGVVSWEKEPGGKDENNPDPSKRERPTLGLPIILNMKTKSTRAARWEGDIYNAENGKTYSGRISLIGEDSLKIEGCVLGLLCGGETWTRVKLTVDAPQKSVVTPQTEGSHAEKSRTASPEKGKAATAEKSKEPEKTKTAAKPPEKGKAPAAKGKTAQGDKPPEEIDVCTIVTGKSADAP